METSNQRSNKRAREEIEDTSPTVLISQASTATITDETVNQNRKFLTASPALGQKHNTDRLTTKLNRMKETSARYVSKRDFLSQCIKIKLVPKGLELTLGLTIGNFDQDNWYSILKEFSLTLMSNLVRFYDKTIKETNDETDQTESMLKTKFKEADYE